MATSDELRIALELVGLDKLAVLDRAVKDTSLSVRDHNTALREMRKAFDEAYSATQRAAGEGAEYAATLRVQDGAMKALNETTRTQSTFTQTMIGHIKEHRQQRRMEMYAIRESMMALTAITTVFGVAGNESKGLTKTITTAAGAFMGLSFVLTTLIEGPWGWIIAGVGTLIIVLKELLGQTDIVTKAFHSHADAIKGTTDAYANWISKMDGARNAIIAVSEAQADATKAQIVVAERLFDLIARAPTKYTQILAGGMTFPATVGGGASDAERLAAVKKNTVALDAYNKAVAEGKDQQEAFGAAAKAVSEDIGRLKDMYNAFRMAVVGGAGVTVTGERPVEETALDKAYRQFYELVYGSRARTIEGIHYGAPGASLPADYRAGKLGGVTEQGKPIEALLRQKTPEEIAEEVAREFMRTRGEAALLSEGLMSGFRSVGSSIEANIHTKLMKAFRDGKTVADQLITGLLDGITQIMTRLGSAGAISGLISLIPGAPAFGGLFKLLGGWQHGGVLTEPVFGVGARSGGMYTFGEAGPERFTPIDGGAGARYAGAGEGTSPKMQIVKIALEGRDLVLALKMNEKRYQNTVFTARV